MIKKWHKKLFVTLNIALAKESLKPPFTVTHIFHQGHTYLKNATPSIKVTPKEGQFLSKFHNDQLIWVEIFEEFTDHYQNK